MVTRKKIVNTVICYNNTIEVLCYAKKLSLLSDAEQVCLIVIINKLENENISDFKSKIKQINLETLVCNASENLGYMNGMLFGYEQYKKETGNHIPQFVIMSNTDIDYPDNKFLSKLIDKQYEDDIWGIGPAVFVPERNTYDNPIIDQRRSVEEINQLIKKFGMPIYNKLYIKGSLIKGKLMKKDIGKSHRVYEVHGCYFIVKGIMADELLKSPFGALLYSEETYIAEMVYKYNKVEFYDADLIINHIEHSVTGKLETKKLAKYLCDSMKVIKRDFY